MDRAAFIGAVLQALEEKSELSEHDRLSKAFDEMRFDYPDLQPATIHNMSLYFQRLLSNDESSAHISHHRVRSVHLAGIRKTFQASSDASGSLRAARAHLAAVMMLSHIVVYHRCCDDARPLCALSITPAENRVAMQEISAKQLERCIAECAADAWNAVPTADALIRVFQAPSTISSHVNQVQNAILNGLVGRWTGVSGASDPSTAAAVVGTHRQVIQVLLRCLAVGDTSSKDPPASSGHSWRVHLQGCVEASYPPALQLMQQALLPPSPSQAVSGDASAADPTQCLQALQSVWMHADTLQPVLRRADPAAARGVLEQGRAGVHALLPRLTAYVDSAVAALRPKQQISFKRREGPSVPASSATTAPPHVSLGVLARAQAAMGLVHAFVEGGWDRRRGTGVHMWSGGAVRVVQEAGVLSAVGRVVQELQKVYGELSHGDEIRSGGGDGTTQVAVEALGADQAGTAEILEALCGAMHALLGVGWGAALAGDRETAGSVLALPGVTQALSQLDALTSLGIADAASWWLLQMAVHFQRPITTPPPSNIAVEIVSHSVSQGETALRALSTLAAGGAAEEGWGYGGCRRVLFGLLACLERVVSLLEQCPALQCQDHSLAPRSLILLLNPLKEASAVKPSIATASAAAHVPQGAVAPPPGPDSVPKHRPPVTGHVPSQREEGSQCERSDEGIQPSDRLEQPDSDAVVVCEVNMAGISAQLLSATEVLAQGEMGTGGGGRVLDFSTAPLAGNTAGEGDGIGTAAHATGEGDESEPAEAKALRELERAAAHIRQLLKRLTACRGGATGKAD